MASIQTKNSLAKSTTVNEVCRRNKELLQLIILKCCLLVYFSKLIVKNLHSHVHVVYMKIHHLVLWMLFGHCQTK